MALTPIVYYTIFRHKNVRKIETIGSLLFFCVSIAQHVAIRYAQTDFTIKKSNIQKIVEILKKIANSTRMFQLAELLA